MIVKLENYHGKYKIVSLALNQTVREDLLKNEIEFVYISENDIRLYPEDVVVSKDKDIIEKLRNAHDYDVYELWENGKFSEYYDDSSLDNYFFVTGKCNSNCVMCPSPDISRQKGGNTSVDTLIEIAKHIPADASHLTITGGEPFMVGPDIFRFFEFLREKFECTDFLLLTNGRIFAVDSYVERFVEKAPKNSIVAIPIHGSTANIHDMITQSKGSFNQTKIGIKKLLKAGIHVELGTVVYSDTFGMSALMGILVLVVVIAINSIVIAKRICEMHFNKRYNTYVKDLRFKNIELIDDLAVYSKVEPEKVIKDLKKAVKMKLIPQGHFGKDDLIFIVSDEVYEKYKDKQAVYDRYYRKQVEERLRMKERTKEMQAIMDQGQGYIEKIHESNDIIKDKMISQKLDRMENVVSMIFHEVDVNPQNADKLGMFMNYYLPTTEKLLEAYIEIDEKQIKGKSLEKTKKDIEGAIDKIIDSFEGLLDKFYHEKEMDIATDISAMEILMKQDGLSE